MNADDIFSLARDKTPPPESMTLSERMLYTIARNIYKSYNGREISLDQAREEKAQAIRQFNDIVRKERDDDKKRTQLFRLTDEIKAAMVAEKPVTHTHMGISAPYTIRGVITRYSKEKGWTYSLELQDLKAGCIVYAALEDTEVRK